MIEEPGVDDLIAAAACLIRQSGEIGYLEAQEQVRQIFRAAWQQAADAEAEFLALFGDEETLH